MISGDHYLGNNGEGRVVKNERAIRVVKFDGTAGGEVATRMTRGRRVFGIFLRRQKHDRPLYACVRYNRRDTG